MDILELEALMIRSQAVGQLLRHGHVRGEEALAMVVIPSEDVLRASLEQARRQGVSNETKKMFGRRTGSDRQIGPAPVTTVLSTPPKVIVTIDELVASL